MSRQDWLEVVKDAWAVVDADIVRPTIESWMQNAPPNRDDIKHPLGYPTWGTEEVLAALECLVSQRTTMWEKCAAFENEFAVYLNTSDAVMVNSGSSADLVMMLAAREVGMLNPGDEVLLPAVTWPTQAWSVIQAGFIPKFVDVDINTLQAEPEALDRAIGPKTKAIFLTHLMGSPCDMAAIRNLAQDRRLLVFEDCCEALGADYGGHKVGTFGIASTFSFFASHHISTMEGGMIATYDDQFADACRLMRAHGWARDQKYSNLYAYERAGMVADSRYFFLGQGFNFRPTELQGAIGSVQLRKLDTMNEARNKNAAKVQSLFRTTNGHTIEALLPTSQYSDPAWFALPFVLRDGLPYSRADVVAHLAKHGIDSRPIVAGNLLRHPAFSKYAACAADHLPGANRIHDNGFYIGLPPFESDMNGVIGILNGMDVMLRN